MVDARSGAGNIENECGTVFHVGYQRSKQELS
jgi:hypothetical protein